jgi:hypothetical protein
MFQSTVLKRIFGSNRNEVAESGRKFHNEELHNLHSSPNFISLMRWVGHVVHMRKMRNGVVWCTPVLEHVAFLEYSISDSQLGQCGPRVPCLGSFTPNTPCLHLCSSGRANCLQNWLQIEC